MRLKTAKIKCIEINLWAKSKNLKAEKYKRFTVVKPGTDSQHAAKLHAKRLSYFSQWWLRQQVNLGDVSIGLCRDVVHVELTERRKMVECVCQIITQQTNATWRVRRRTKPKQRQRRKMGQVCDILNQAPSATLNSQQKTVLNQVAAQW